MEFLPGSAGQQHSLPTKLVSTLQGHTASVLVVRSNPAGTYCLSGSKDRSVRLWNPNKGTHINTYRGHSSDVRGLAVSTDNSQFVSGGGDKQVNLWDVATARVIRRFRGHDAAVNDVHYAADEQVAVSASYDQAVSFWDLRSRSNAPIQSVKVAKDSVTALVVTQNPYVFAGSVDGSVSTLDVRAGSLVRDELHQPVTGLAGPPDGTFVVAACTDHAVRLLDRASGQVLAKYEGHVHGSFQVECRLVCGDAVVAAGSEDGKVFFWDMVSKRLVAEVAAHKGVVSSMAVLPDDTSMLTGGADGEIKFWQA